MSSFNTLPESTSNTTNDFFIIRQGGVDVKVKRSVFLNLMYPIGSTWMTIDIAVTPAMQGFPGTWELLPEDCVLVTSGIADLDIGVVKGSNEVSTPLPQHNHSASLSTKAAHTHVINNGVITYDSIENALDTPAPTTAPFEISYLSTTGSHNHTLTLSSTGITAPMIDVKGERYHINVWKRTL